MNHYNGFVITNKDCDIYIKENDDYIKMGKIYKDTIVKLKKNLNKNDYLEIENMDDNYYIEYDNVRKVSKDIDNNDRYKNYIVFNENVVADKINLYKEDRIVYSLNKKMSLPIYIKDEDKYYVEYNNQLFYVKKEEVSTIKNDNTSEKNITNIGVLNYHSFYDDNLKNEREKCNTVICSSTTQFKEHLDYIKENNFFTPTMDELEKYIDGKLQLPKSVVITIDDGWKAELGIKMLNEYKLNATLFLITGYYNPDDYRSDYIEIHSHTDLLHDGGKCSGGQGSGLKCLSEDIILNDFKTSRKKLNDSTVLCYPFYEYNDYTIGLAKKAGFTMAFTGESNYSDNLVKVGSDKFKLPRFVVVN